MAMRGAALKAVISALNNRKTFGKDVTGSAMSAVWLPDRIERGQFPADRELPRPDEVEYVVYSYETPIAWLLKDGTVIVPNVRYSNTTTNHQSLCRIHL